MKTLEDKAVPPPDSETLLRALDTACKVCRFFCRLHIIMRRCQCCVCVHSHWIWLVRIAIVIGKTSVITRSQLEPTTYPLRARVCVRIITVWLFVWAILLRFNLSQFLITAPVEVFNYRVSRFTLDLQAVCTGERDMREQHSDIVGEVFVGKNKDKKMNSTKGKTYSRQRRSGWSWGKKSSVGLYVTCALYGSESLAVDAREKKLLAFEIKKHDKCCRRMLGICWVQKRRNEELFRSTGGGRSFLE